MNTPTLSTADKILDSARQLILAGGYNSFSYADIAEAVGIRKASIHHHFPSKLDLVQALLRLYRDQLKKGLSGISQQITDPLARLRAYTGYWQKCILDASAPICVCALLASEMPILPEELRAEIKTYFNELSAWLTSVFEEGFEQRRIRIESKPELEAETFMALVHGAMLSARAYDDPNIFGAIVTPLVNRLAVPE